MYSLAPYTFILEVGPVSEPSVTSLSGTYCVSGWITRVRISSRIIRVHARKLFHLEKGVRKCEVQRVMGSVPKTSIAQTQSGFGWGSVLKSFGSVFS